ncbi:MAG: IgGFc-binding protein [Polyangiaceae bacterium]
MRDVFSLFVLVGLAAGCSASQGGGAAGGSSSGGSGANGGGGGGGGSDAAICGLCTASSYTPCVNGAPGAPVQCEGPCVPDLGCLACAPGETLCVGNEVHRCTADGQAGELVEACDVAAGKLCGGGKCRTACELAAGAPSNVGCEFWAVDLDNIDYGQYDPASAPWGVVLSNAGDAQANVTIEINEAPVGQPLSLKVVAQASIGAGSLEKVVLPTRELDCGTKPNDYASPGTCLSSNAFRITSSAPIVVYQFNLFENSYSNDASLLLPTSALGKWHRIINWQAGHPALKLWPGTNEPLLDRSYVTIVGTEAGTSVKVRPSWRIKGNPPVALTQPGGEIAVTLGPFDVLNLETDDATESEVTLADLSGSVVESDKPVAVFSGVEQTGAPIFLDPAFFPPGSTSTLQCCNDHLEEQIFPVESVGTKYVIARSPVRSTTSWREPDILRFVGVAETAHVTTTLPAPHDKFILEPGQVVTTWTKDDITVSADKPVTVGQILISGGYTGATALGDPALTVFPPVSQYKTDYVILTPGSWKQNWTVITAEVGSQVLLDGAPTDACAKEPAINLDGTTYESRRCPLMEGVHRLNGDRPFGIVMYGYGSAGSYALVGGSGVKKIYDPPPVR